MTNINTTPIGPIMGLFNLGGGELLIILALVVILFGAKKLPDLAKGLGQGIREFKRASRETADDFSSHISDASASSKATPAAGAAAPTTDPHRLNPTE